MKKGYNVHVSLYGVQWNKEEDRGQYVRVEILMRIPWTERNIATLYDWFKTLKLLPPYSIWIYDDERDAVRMVWSAEMYG